MPHTDTSSFALGPLTTNQFGERYFYALNHNSFETVSAYTLYESTLSQALFKPHTLSIIVGSDSGLLAQYLCQKGLPVGARFIFVEPEDILEQLQAQGLLTNLLPEIAFSTLETWETQAGTFKIGDYFYISAVQSLNSLCAQEAALDVYPEFSWQIAEQLNQYHWRYSMSLGCESFIIQQLTNLADNLLPASLLTNAFKDQTVLILAGGPSLDLALPWVQRNRKQLIIFAVSRIARQLQEWNLEPDFIFSVDPTDLSFDISKEMLHFNQAIFVYAYHTVSTLVQQWGGLALYLGERLPWKSTLNPKNINGTGPTVTNTAISVAHALGFKRIILAGVDLCFTREGFTHAQGSNEALAGPKFNLTSLQIETNAGQQAPTSCDFLTAIHNLALQAKQLTNSGCELLTLSAQAAKIEHITYCPIDQIFLSPPSDNWLALIKARLQANQSKNNQTRQALLAEVQRAQYQIKQIQHLAERALQLNNQMYNADGIISNHKDKRQLDKLEQQLKRHYRKFSLLIKQFAVRHFLKITRPFEAVALEAQEVKALGALYYTAYRDGAEKLLTLLATAQERIESRQEETALQPDIERLLQQWQQDKSYARATLWQAQYPGVIPDTFKPALAKLAQQFASQINERNTKHLAQAKQHASLTTFKTRAKLLFKHGKLTALLDLQAGLRLYPAPEQAIMYQYLVSAYLAELQGETERALQAYQTIIEGTEPSLQEDALLRVAQISLADQVPHQAYLALQCLAQLSPKYLPWYADINRLLGQWQEASELYYAYLLRCPNDIIVQLKLANLHTEQQAYAAAEVMLNYTLNQAPDNPAALQLKARLTQLLALA